MLASLVAAFGLSYERASLDIVKENMLYLAVFAVTSCAVFAILFLANRVHRSLWTFLGIAEMITIGYVALFGSVVSGLLYFAFVPISYHRLGFITMLGMFAFLGMITLRVFYRALRERVVSTQYEGPRKRALIIGAGEAGYVLLKELQKTLDCMQG
ncbi:hypothetical protein IPL68_07440 [Candidatus Saccharibacteria bacterium]|nr:MAG: hypothetical protein IPL68_07440 [Candidatus Saccharibacteria bacterium]